MGRLIESPFCCDHPASPDRHVEGCPTLDNCPICGLNRSSDDPGEQFAVWLHGRGWLVDVCGNEAAVADRLSGATWFPTADEARTELLKLNDAHIGEDSDVGTVVTL